MNRTSKPKIAIMSYAMDNRKGKGTALYTRKLVKHLIDDGRFELYLVHYDKVDDPLYKEAHEILMPQVRLPFATRWVRQLLFYWQYRHKRFDIIHWCQPRLYPFFWLAPASRRIVMAFGAGDLSSGGPFPLSRRMFNFVLKHFSRYLDAIIASSDFGKQEILDWYRPDPARVCVIYLGGGEDFTRLDAAEARSVAQRVYGIEGAYILDVSMHTPHKNIPALIQAYVIARNNGVSHKLVIVGGKGSGWEQDRALADSSLYGADIMFIEYVSFSDFNALYSAADLFVFPSLNEGFGIPVIEAFASGTPVITSNLTSLPEVAGDAAIIIDPEDTVGIAEAICRVLSNDELRRALIAKGLQRAALFTWEMTGTRTAGLYESLLGRAAFESI